MTFWNILRRKGVRKYEAARPTNIAAGFTAFSNSKSAREEIRWDLRGLIAHSRQQAQNNDYLKGYLDMLRRNVVGHAGIGLQNDAQNPNGTADKLANDTIEAGWDAWGRHGSPTLDGALSWKTLQSVAIQTIARDGTVLLRLYRGRQYGPYGLKVQLLEIDFLDIDMNTDLPNGNAIRMGIEADSDTRVVAYHLFTSHPGDAGALAARKRIRVPADQMLCIFRPERPGQQLGVPWAYTALRRLNMLRGYEEAAITAARAGAAKMGFYVNLDGEEEDPSSIDKEIASGNVTDTGHLPRDIEPGVNETLPKGYDYKPHDPAYPSGEIKPFMNVALQGAAVGLGVSYVSLTSDLAATNFSSLRAGKGDERDEWRDIQAFFIEQLHDRVFREWLGVALLTGALGTLPYSKIDKFAQPRWRPRGWAYVSPGEEASANQREMAALIRSPQQIVSERGEDLETVFAEIAAAKTLAKTYGLDFNPMPPGHENAGNTPAADPAAP